MNGSGHKAAHFNNKNQGSCIKATLRFCKDYVRPSIYRSLTLTLCFELLNITIKMLIMLQSTTDREGRSKDVSQFHFNLNKNMHHVSCAA